VSLVDFMEFYLLHHFKPGRYQETEVTQRGRRTLEQIGCTQCHIPDLQIERDRCVADIETVYDPKNGIFNNLFATAIPLFRTVDDGTDLPPLKLPAGEPLLVENIFTAPSATIWDRTFTNGTLTAPCRPSIPATQAPQTFRNEGTVAFSWGRCLTTRTIRHNVWIV
jgi:hypothetical protein